MIAILCPTYRRAKQCKRMVDSTCVDVFLGADAVDLFDYKLRDIIVKDYIHCHPLMPTVQKWNDLAAAAMKNPEYNLFMLGADDMYFSTPGWDFALNEHYKNLENKIHVYALKDSRDPLGTPHPIVTREWIEAMGYAFPPIFLHWNLDTWTVEIARANNCFTHMDKFTLTHDKPSDTGFGDNTHNGIRSYGWRERDKWVAEKMAHLLEGEKVRLAYKIMGSSLKSPVIVDQNHGMIIHT